MFFVALYCHGPSSLAPLHQCNAKHSRLALVVTVRIFSSPSINQFIQTLHRHISRAVPVVRASGAAVPGTALLRMIAKLLLLYDSGPLLFLLMWILGCLLSRAIWCSSRQLICSLLLCFALLCCGPLLPARCYLGKNNHVPTAVCLPPPASICVGMLQGMRQQRYFYTCAINIMDTRKSKGWTSRFLYLPIRRTPSILAFRSPRCACSYPTNRIVLLLEPCAVSELGPP